MRDSKATPEPTDLDERIAEYGSHVLAVEPTGVEKVPEAARHGHPLSLMWTWIPPNMEFATVFIGVIAVLFFGLDFWTAAVALLLGAAVGAVAHGVASTYGPRFGVPQMVAGRIAFGRRGTALPAGLNAAMAGLGWFAVNSVSGAFALSELTGLPTLPSLVLVVAAQIGIGYMGHNFVHVFSRCIAPLVTAVFLVTSAVVLAGSDLGAPPVGPGRFGGFMLAFSAAFGYTAGWNPFAADYTRYLPSTTPHRRVAFFPALGLFLSISLLMLAGAASATIAGGGHQNPTKAFTSTLPGWLGTLTLLVIVLGSISANALNVYSAGLSFISLGLRWMPRGPVALVIGTAGFLVAWAGLRDTARSYEAYLLVVSYWVAPWQAVVFTDQWLRYRARMSDREAFRRITDPAYEVWAGPIAMLLGTVASVLLFSNQQRFSGYIPRVAPQVGDLTCVAGFLLTAVLYAALRRLPALGPRQVGRARP